METDLFLLFYIGSMLFNMLVISRLNKKGYITDGLILALLYLGGIILGPLMAIFLVLAILVKYLDGE